MTLNPGTAVSKPVEKQFARWEGGPENASPIIDWILVNGGTARWREEEPFKIEDGRRGVPEYIAIDTLEGTMRALAGDVIIRGVHGEFYPCKPDIFEQTYDVWTEPSA